MTKYAGHYVAWSPDGASIVASDADELHLDATVREAGYDPAEVLITFVPPADEILLGAPEFGE